MKRIIFLFLLMMFIYVTTFNIFMTGIFRIPAPALFLAPLIYFFKDDHVKFTYFRELVIFFIAGFLYYAAAQGDIMGFFSLMIVVSSYMLFFNYVVGSHLQRLYLAIGFFMFFLLVSGIIMFVDHKINLAPIRAILVMDTILQAPSGIATTSFTFGYQMAALTPFLFLITLAYKQKWIIIMGSFCLALALIFLGMQRSVLLAFGTAVGCFFLLYYRGKSLLILGSLCAIFFFAQGSIEQFSEGKNNQNILNKNIENSRGKQERGDLMGENIEIIKNYPIGLLFYNKSWNDVVQHNYVYRVGNHIVSSHNAYLMFITYLGPLLAVILLLILYFKVGRIIFYALSHIRDKENALLVCLCLSFISVSFNSFFHNEWLVSVSGPTLFLYFAILQVAKIKSEENLLIKTN